MSNDPLEWDCPATDCGGTYRADIVYNVGVAETSYRSSCDHPIGRCTSCGAVDVVDRTEHRMSHTGVPGDPGRVHERSYCVDCASKDDLEVVR